MGMLALALGSWVWVLVVLNVVEVRDSGRTLGRQEWKERTASRTSRADVGRPSDDADGAWDGCRRSWGKVAFAPHGGASVQLLQPPPIPKGVARRVTVHTAQVKESAGCVALGVELGRRAEWARDGKGRR
ncbi:hypothetical protein DFH09DRAFT_1093773 [Mycena vulgaris]|nr:hypothetical protein DFH09DRAFT_1093773 [Mycena vulgaris]